MVNNVEYISKQSSLK